MSLLAVATKVHSIAFIAIILIAPLLFCSILTAATPPKKIRLAYSAFAYANPPFWIAHDLKLFDKYGLDTELVTCLAPDRFKRCSEVRSMSPKSVARPR